jgi:hypothetical protein
MLCHGTKTALNTWLCHGTKTGLKSCLLTATITHLKTRHRPVKDDSFAVLIEFKQKVSVEHRSSPDGIGTIATHVPNEADQMRMQVTLLVFQSVRCVLWSWEPFGK